MVVHGKNLIKGKIMYLDVDHRFLIPESREEEFTSDTKSMPYMEFMTKWEKFDIINHREFIPEIYAEWK